MSGKPVCTGSDPAAARSQTNSKSKAALTEMREKKQSPPYS